MVCLNAKRGEVSRSGVAEWEEPRHPGTASHKAKYPTTPHSATRNPHGVPPDCRVVSKVAALQAFCVWRVSAAGARAAATGRSAGRVAFQAPVARPEWGAVG